MHVQSCFFENIIFIRNMAKKVIKSGSKNGEIEKWLTKISNEYWRLEFNFYCVQESSRNRSKNNHKIILKILKAQKMNFENQNFSSGLRIVIEAKFFVANVIIKKLALYVYNFNTTVTNKHNSFVMLYIYRL